MTTRRKFIKGFGLLGAFAAGMTTSRESLAKTEYKVTSDKRMMPDQTGGVLTLYGGRVQRCSTTITNESYTNTLQLSVGKDNRLWIKSDGEWKRLSVDN